MQTQPLENDISKIIVDVAYNLHVQYGPGLFESVYEEIMCYELNKRSLLVQCQQPIPLIHDQVKFEAGFRADIIVENLVLIELKSVEALAPVHYKQVQTYLRLTGLRLGLLINFNVALIKDGVHRIVNKLPDIS
jgi:GxxExxY protein